MLEHQMIGDPVIGDPETLQSSVAAILGDRHIRSSVSSIPSIVEKTATALRFAHSAATAATISAPGTTFRSVALDGFQYLALQVRTQTPASSQLWNDSRVHVPLGS